MLPPNLLNQPGGEADPKQQLAAAQSQLTALSQQHQMLVQQLNQATQTIQTKKIEHDSQERIAFIRAQVELAKAEARKAEALLKTHGAGALKVLDRQLQTIEDNVNQILTPPNEGTPVEAQPIGGQPNA
jgi:septation ring formation regulator EzrA